MREREKEKVTHVRGIKKQGQGLCPVEISTGHVRIWTRVHYLTYSLETSIGHKPHHSLNRA